MLKDDMQHGCFVLVFFFFLSDKDILPKRRHLVERGDFLDFSMWHFLGFVIIFNKIGEGGGVSSFSANCALAAASLHVGENSVQ